jgi:hypothetical protein
MTKADAKVTRLITFIAGFVAIVVVIAMPVGYFTLPYQHQSGALDAEVGFLPGEGYPSAEAQA